jgi:hypothetical protein
MIFCIASTQSNEEKEGKGKKNKKSIGNFGAKHHTHAT